MNIAGESRGAATGTRSIGGMITREGKPIAGLRLGLEPTRFRWAGDRVFGSEEKRLQSQNELGLLSYQRLSVSQLSLIIVKNWC
jgi:hypothetical protein